MSFGLPGGTISVTGADGQIAPHVVKAMQRRAQAGGGVSRLIQAPFNPLIQNLDIPQDWALRNTYKRHFFRTNPIVGAAIELHSEFCLSDFHLEHDDGAIEEFLNDMLHEACFTEIVFMAAMEYWLIGEFTMFSFFDDTDNPACYTGFALLDPNKIQVASNNFVQGHQKETVHLTFDETMQKIVQRGPRDPLTGDLYQKLPTDMVAACKHNRALPLSPLQVSRMKRGGYFNLRGDSSLERVFPLLLMKDELRSMQRCHDEKTECLTRAGWKCWYELTFDDEVATVHPVTNFIEYHRPTGITVEDYEGEMIHFKGETESGDGEPCGGKLDILVTPNHRMWARKRKHLGSHKYKVNDSYEMMEATSLVRHSKVLSAPKGWEGVPPNATITIGSVTYDYLDYVRIIGYFVSEGSTVFHLKQPGYTKEVRLWQRETSEWWQDIHDLVTKYGWGETKKTPSGGCASHYIRCNAHAEHFRSLFGESKYQHELPVEIKSLPTRYLLELVRTMVNGDGYRQQKGRVLRHGYGSVCERLVDDLQEILLKCGFRCVKGGFQRKPHLKDVEKGFLGNFEYCHTVGWSKFPDEQLENSNKEIYITGKRKVPYKGKVWCVSVPNQIFITRRHGRIAIQGNSIAKRAISPLEIWKIGETNDPADSAEIESFRELLQSTYYDVNTSIVWHHALQCQIIGSEGRMPNLWAEFDAIDNEVCAGLLINKGLILGDSSTFASDVVRLDILIQRYLLFRAKLEKWIERLLAPILKIHEIYVPETKVKSMRFREMCGKGRPLAYPTVRWDKQSLRDESAKLELLTKLVEKGLVPESTLIRMLNIDPRTAAQKVDEERLAKIERYENLRKQIQAKHIAITPEIAQMLGMGSQEGGAVGGSEESGGLPASFGGGGDGGEPMPTETGGGNLPEAIAPPGGATAGIPKPPGVQGSPSESHQPAGLPS